MAVLEPDLSIVPAGLPPPGVTPNFVDPPSRAGSVIAVSVVMITLSTVFLLLRFYTRLVLVRVFGLSDYILLAGYLCAVANTALAFAEINAGLGRHAWDIHLSDIFPRQLRYVWWQVQLYILSLGCTKIAILGLYPRISPSRTFSICVWALVALVASLSLGTLLWSILNCLPVHNNWTFQAGTQGKCLPKISFVAFTGASNITTDLAILILPIMMLRHLSLPRKKKIAVAIVLASGSFASSISVIRMIFSLQSLTSVDPSYENVDVVVWSVAELHAAIICACMLTLRALLRRIHSAFLTTSIEESEPAGCRTREGVDEIALVRRQDLNPYYEISGGTRKNKELRDNPHKARDEHIFQEKKFQSEGVRGPRREGV